MTPPRTPPCADMAGAIGRRRRRRRRIGLSVLLATAIAALLVAAPARACGVALVLAIDVSSSVDDEEYALQTQGLADAFRAPEVIDAVIGAGGVMTTVVYWSGYTHQEVRVPWTPVRTPDDMELMARRLERIHRRYRAFSTALGKALELVEEIWTAETALCGRRVLDVSGDGVNNSGPPTEPMRDRLVARGVMINGLVIKGADPDPEPFYRAHVVGGAGAFVEIAEGFSDYARAIRRKLFREIATPLAAGPQGPQLAAKGGAAGTTAR